MTSPGGHGRSSVTGPDSRGPISPRSRPVQRQGETGPARCRGGHPASASGEERRGRSRVALSTIHVRGRQLQDDSTSSTGEDPSQLRRRQPLVSIPVRDLPDPDVPGCHRGPPTTTCSKARTARSANGPCSVSFKRSPSASGRSRLVPSPRSTRCSQDQRGAEVLAARALSRPRSTLPTGIRRHGPRQPPAQGAVPVKYVDTFKPTKPDGARSTRLRSRPPGRQQVKEALSWCWRPRPRPAQRERLRVPDEREQRSRRDQNVDRLVRDSTVKLFEVPLRRSSRRTRSGTPRTVRTSFRLPSSTTSCPRFSARAHHPLHHPRDELQLTKKSKMHSAGKDELRVFLGRTRDFADLRLPSRPEKWQRTKQRTTSGGSLDAGDPSSPSRCSTPSEKELIERLRQAVGKAHMIINAGDHVRLLRTRHAA